MNKIAVVILNYMNYKETINCTDSVLKQKNIEFEIVIVDNGSPNESYKELGKEYRNNNSVHIIKASRNYGYAKGNNIGIRYAKEKCSSDFILLLNSDTEMIQEDYISILISKYKENIAVISGRIIQQRGEIQERYYEYVNFPDTLYFYLQLFFDYHGLSLISNKCKQMLKKKDKTEVLHGSCLMLTPSFFKYYKMLYHRTFLYSEEVLLYIYCNNAGITQMKVEEAVILHKGKQSSKYLYGNKDSKKMRYLTASYKYVVWESFKAYVKTILKRKIFKPGKADYKGEEKHQ